MAAMQMTPFVHSKTGLRTLTGSGYFPVFALVDVYIVFQVDLYPAAVSLVVKRDLLARQGCV